jgi:hypothetical protein
LSVKGPTGRREKPLATVVREELHDKQRPTKPPCMTRNKKHAIRYTAATAHLRHDAPAGRTWNPAAMTAANCERADAGGSDLLKLLLHAVSLGESKAS